MFRSSGVESRMGVTGLCLEGRVVRVAAMDWMRKYVL